uniref:26S proteasome non-ATPase regulatory subunit 1 homolog n=1 Tax=Dunaliella tertiolecta TaxID=3047 RepID=A0A7S3VN96_DUNTE|mmetsp:Transcript_22058/g.61077  ORF Transcript_22058/g.61077 Transcript_22058/m.61077 type:complete len:1028 (-) Transcript_22058:310-3393(-)|eukprot:CAMPEP_0202387446 /NCGR_PEP_ID=MMETSP1127-20130417/72102_1 /ASSEMBLY_ACC=CAM_ASM_000462 /TAXON_ID=3047 /ORGANISM="Dunaliella tertiolecta, Strain CCMP1320" /LENGTH=1027 /DNA_ID=CAMNT_0048988451 /DNA_START=99 /DNA_END=3182 /DNA_ORIENTATION=-
MAAVSSASGLLSLLSEPSDTLRSYALQNLDRVVHEFWFQISASIASVEALYEDEEFGQRELAAIVASKVFYHLGELDDALAYALGAGNLFDVNEQSEYVQTLIARCLDQYFELRLKQVEAKQDVQIDPRLVSIVERMLERCCVHGQFEQAVGVALEARRLDKLEEIIQRSTDSLKTLKYALRCCQGLIINRDFRQQVLRLLIRLYEASRSPDYVDICQCLMFLDDASEVAKILHNLLTGTEDDELLAYQTCFDLVENEMQSFLTKVQSELAALAPKAPTAPAAAEEGGDGTAAMDTDAPAPAPSEPAQPPADAPVPEHVARHASKLKKMKDILSGQTPIRMHLDFLYRHNRADLQILKNIKSAIDSRNSVAHSATVFANAIMHSGTTVDMFLRENMEWLSRATNWAKFSATAGLGVIHRGHLSRGKLLMTPYLPRGGSSTSPFSEGGALYALGFIYANHGHDIHPFLLESLRGSSDEITQHGACLGLGLAGLGTNDEEMFEDVKNILYTDSAVAGEAAGISMGLIMAGTATDKATEMLAYAHDTQHEKIIRGVVLGLALVMYGREEGAETLVEQMSRDQDPIIRYGAMYVLGMAYRGTSNNGAVQKLLHFAVSDVSDDVRRAAVLCLGFVLMNAPQQCPRIVALLAESFNPHVRYGAAMAVGMACAGTGQKDAVALLEPLLLDSVDFVRQGAYIATALVMVQQPEVRLASFRKRLDKSIGNKHEEIMAKLGAIMAAGILDAGGRNVGIGLRSRSGFFRRTSVVGLAVFTQYWYWYPLSYFLSLSFQPTVLMAVNKDLALPKTPIAHVACRPSTFDYLPPVTQEKKEEVSKVPTAVLSTTAKAKERAKKKEAEKEKKAGEGGAAAMDTDASAKPTTDKAATDKAEESKAEPPAPPEPTSHTLDNPARIVPAQARFVSLPRDLRWHPVKATATAGISALDNADAQPPSGILVVKDTRPHEEVQLVATTTAAPAAAAPSTAGASPAPQAPTPAAGQATSQPPPNPPSSGRGQEEEEEPAPPAPFEFRPPQ